MMKVIQATEDHFREFLLNARPIDLEEVEAGSGEPFESHISSLVPNIHNIKTLIDAETGEVLGIGGLEDLGSPTVGGIWLLMTKAIETRKIEFLRFSKKFLKEVFAHYKYLTNAVYKRNKLHIDWLTWIGVKWVKETEDFSIFILERKEGE